MACNTNVEYVVIEAEEAPVIVDETPEENNGDIPDEKEEADNKVPLVRMSQDDPLNPSSTRNYQVDSENNNQGESNMIKEKFIKNP